MKLLIVLVLFCGAMAQPNRAPPEKKPVGATGPIGLSQSPAGIWEDFNVGTHIFISTPDTWANAQGLCLTMGAHLVVIDNQAEEDFVSRLAGGKVIWIGLSDAQQNGQWFWINSEPLGYTDWCDGEPKNKGGNQKCAVTNDSDKKCWDDQECFRRYPYVCEK